MPNAVMLTRCRNLAATAALFLVFSGCGRTDAPAGHARSDRPGCATGTCAHTNAPARRASVKYASLKPSDPIVTVNGVALTKAHLEEECAIQTMLASLANRKLTLEAAEKIASRLRTTAVRRFLLRQAVLAEADRRGISVPDEDFAAFRDRFAAGVGRSTRRFTYAQVTNRLSAAQAAGLDEDLRRDCRYQKMIGLLKKEAEVTVTADEAERRFARIRAYNARAAEAERAAWAEATNVWRRLQGGAPFEGVAAELAGEAPRIDADMAWGTFQLPFFDDDKALQKALADLKPGAFTPPVPGNNGLIIVQLLERLPPADPQDARGDYLRLAKIFFRLPETFDLTDAAQLKKDLQRELSDEKLQAALNRLQLKMEVAHPMGVVDFRTANPTMTGPTRKGTTK